jgi:signal transduction histidine kinase
MTAPQILVVEDERVVALHLRQQLLKLGYEVPPAISSGDHVLRKIEESRPDLILMDVMIEGPLDGIATASHIPPDYHIPVIYLTGHSGEATLRRASATNPYGYLLKPFSGRELHAMIQMALARSRAEQASRAALEDGGQSRKMEALGRLAGDVAQDFNALLTVVYRNLEEMGDYTVEHPKMAELVHDVFKAAMEREKLAAQLLAFSRRQPLTPRVVSVHDLISDVTKDLRDTLGGAIQIQSSLPEELWKTRIDASQLETALLNLAANAFDAMPEGGTLTFKGQNIVLDGTRTDAGSGILAGRYVLLAVTDTGAGMPEDVIERAFEPFFTTKQAGGGIGLGLSQVFGFVRQSGGHISIGSEPGHGTAIRIYLPAIPAEDEAAESTVHRMRIARTPPRTGGEREVVAGAHFQVAESQRGLATHRKNIMSQIHEAMWREHNVHNFRHKLSITAPAEDALRVPWQKAENALFAAVASNRSGVQYRLIVEELPRRNGWDWTVWRPGGTREASRHGRASAVLIAMAAAEDAARLWNEAGESETDRPNE